MGPVFRGEDSETRQPVVVKVIRVGLTPERVAVVGPALRALKDRLVEHPSLCPIIETGVVDVEPYVVSPVIAGDSLDVALREYGPANMADAIPRLRAIADALDTAAAADIAHGSLHLRDIVVSVEATVLTGIGIAAVLERVGVRPPVRRPYCAPEVALGRGISPAGDQYSLAAIAHEWLSGRRIPGPDSILVPTSSPEGAEALGFVFARAMAAEASDRYPSATAFVDALADVSDAVTPRGRSTRRKPVAPPPLLQFDADEAPALTFAPSEPDPVAPPSARVIASVREPDVAAGELDAFAAPPPADGGHAPLALSWADDAIVRHDDDPVHHDDIVRHDDDHGHHDDIVRHDEHRDDEDVPAVSGPRDLGDDVAPDTPHHAAADDFAAADPLSLPYADAGEASADDPAPPAEDADHTTGGLPPWALWGGVLVAVVLLVLLGGRALLRWGTPGPSTTVASAPASAAPGGATPSAPASTASSGATSSGVSGAVSPGGTPERRGNEPPASVPEPADESAAAPARPGTPETASTAPPAAAKAASGPASATPPRASAPASAKPTPAPAATPTPAAAAKTTRPAAPKASPSRPAVAAARQSPSRSAPQARASAPRPAPAAAAPASEALPGRLLVRSSPAGAEVFLNGERRGVAPVAIRALALGAYTVRVQRAGYAPAEQRIVLEAARPARALEITLARAGSSAASSPAAAPAAATTGSLVVDSRPGGARVFVDGAEAGRTPLTLPTVAAGEHAVRIELAGYLNVSTTTRVEPGARARVAVTLTAERPR